MLEREETPEKYDDPLFVKCFDAKNIPYWKKIGTNFKTYFEPGQMQDEKGS